MFVNSLDDFYIHTRTHILNVNKIASKLIDMIEQSEMLHEYYKIPKGYDFQQLKKEIMDGIALHDKAKICVDESFLEENNLDEPLYIELYSRYGKGKNKKEWEITKPIVDKLNKIDEQIIENYCQQFEPWMQNLIKSVESIADKVERGRNPVTPEEMGQPPMIASQFLKGQINEYEMAMVKILEESYHNFCDYRLNKNIISKAKYFSFVEDNNLTNYISLDSLSFTINEDTQGMIKKSIEQILRDDQYNLINFNTIKNILYHKIPYEEKDDLEINGNYNYDQININIMIKGENFDSECFHLVINDFINQEMLSHYPDLIWITHNESPLYDEELTQDLLLSYALDHFKENMHVLENTECYYYLENFCRQLI